MLPCFSFIQSIKSCWGLYHCHLTCHIFSRVPLMPKPFHLVALCLPWPLSCLFSSQKPEWLLKMWVRSHHSSAQALQEVYILLRKIHPHPFPWVMGLTLWPTQPCISYLLSSLCLALCSSHTRSFAVFKLAWDILPPDIYLAPFLPSFMSLLAFYLLKAPRSIAVGEVTKTVSR